jgi:hypothetical protein
MGGRSRLNIAWLLDGDFCARVDFLRRMDFHFFASLAVTFFASLAVTFFASLALMGLT